MKGAIIIEGHIQGLSNVRALGEQGIDVYVFDVCNCLARYSKYCKKFFKCPSFSSEEFIDYLLSIGKKENLDGWVLIPSNDHIVENLSKNKERLRPFFKTIVPDIQLLDKIINKKNLLEIAQENNVPIPKTCSQSNASEAQLFDFPVLIRGAKGLSFYKSIHAKAIQCDNIDDFDTKYREIIEKFPKDGIIIQELIPNSLDHKVLSFTCFADNGTIKSYWMGEKMREHPIKYGTATLSRSVYVPEILNYAKPLINALNYTGVCEVEFMFDPRDGIYKLIEINPRTWLWVGLAKACGVNYAFMIYCYLNGLSIEFPDKYDTNLKWINWITDLSYGIKGLSSGNYSIHDYFSLLHGRKVCAVWSWNDILPGVVFPFMSFYIFMHRK